MPKMHTQDDLDRMYQEAEERRRTTPTATAIAYDAATRTFTMRLLAGGVVQFAADQVRELTGATEGQLAEVTLSPGGSAVNWPAIDMDIAVPGLVLDLVAGEGWRPAMRAMLMREVQGAKTPAKAEAARRNGAKGGRPRKAAAS
jgi:hypothetical protein